jgi:hypothetical protein
MKYYIRVEVKGEEFSIGVIWCICSGTHLEGSIIKQKRHGDFFFP